MAKLEVDNEGEGNWYVAFRFGRHDFETDWNMRKRAAVKLGTKLAAALPNNVTVFVSSMPERDR